MKQLKKFTLVALCFLLSSIALQAQNSTVEVKGTVTDDKNEPLIGVSIVVKDKPGLGVISDIDGNYKIKVDPYSYLVFSYIGYESQEMLVKPENLVLNVILKDSKESVLEEITVTGTGVQKKVTLTGAVTTVNMETLKTPSPNLANALQGNVAGVLGMQTSGEPGSNTSEFWIRGMSTFGGGASALILVDGFERTLNEINIEDIESFTVLKDASTTAIYGSRGANGVILITSKRGHEGKVKAKAKVEYSYVTRTITPKTIDGITYAEMMNEAHTTRNLPARFSDDDMLILREGLDPDLFPSVDWQDLLLRDGAPMLRATVDVKGGSSIAKYFLSGSYLDESGMYKTDKALKDYDTNSNYKRWNYRMNIDLQLTSSTLVEVGLAGYLDKQSHTGFNKNLVWESILGYSPISTPFQYSDGRIPSLGSGNARVNPWVLATQTGFAEIWNNAIQTNITLKQDLNAWVKGLKFTARYGFDTYNKNNIRRYKWPELWKAERNRDSDGELIYSRMQEELLMSQSAGSTGERREFLQADLSYNRTYGNHTLGAILKYTQEAKVNTSNVGNDVIKGVDRRQQGLAGNVSYGYRNRYLANFNFGYNGSENFAKGHQFGFFPAISVAWNVAEEAFVRNNFSWLEMFKIRYSYGEVGNDYIGKKDEEALQRFPYLADFGSNKYSTWSTNEVDIKYNWGDLSGPFSYNGLSYTSVSNQSVTWEVAKKHDLGIDLYLFGDKIGLTVDYFNERRDGIYMERSFLPAMVGLQSIKPYANMGSVKTTGFDGNFVTWEKIGKVKLTLRGNFTLSKNIVEEADELSSHYPYTKKAGFRMDQARGLIALGLFKDYEDIRNSPKQSFSATQPVMPGDIKYKDVNGDGLINSDDIVPIGATTKPNLIYGAGFVAEWNGFDVNVHFQGAGKSSFFINGASVYPFQYEDWGVMHQGIADLNRWVLGENEDPNADLPRLFYGNNSNNYRASTFWMRDGSYLRLKTFEVGYTLPKAVVNKLHLDNIRINFIGQNLVTFSKFKLWDPEMGSANGRKYPLPKTFTLGLIVSI